MTEPYMADTQVVYRDNRYAYQLISGRPFSEGRGGSLVGGEVQG